MDTRLVDFVKDNPAIESIITREIVRDLDSKALDLDKLLEKSALRVSFQIDESGNVTRRRIEQSSRVPSIDHLAVELVRLLQKYQFLSGMKGLQRVLVSIQIDENVEIRLEGEASDEAAAEEIRKQISNVLTLMRFALGKDAITVLEGVRIEINESRVLISKSFEKERLVDFLMQYYRAEPSKN
jgi:TonB family protein